MKPPLEGKVAIVSGSGRGIGRAVALKLAHSGARVVINDLDPDICREVVDTIQTAGGQAIAFAGDVTDPEFGNGFVNAAINAYGALDIIINNAGYTWDAILQKTSDEQWEAMIAVHLTAPFRILRAAQPIIAKMAKAELAAGLPMGRRSVINVSSIAGLGGNAGQVGYASGKAGVVGLTKTVAKEWGRFNVTVNTIAFGVIGTRLTLPEPGQSTIEMKGREIKVGVGAGILSGMETSIPLGRAGSPEDAAGAVYILCLEEAGYISGEVLICGGGYTL